MKTNNKMIDLKANMSGITLSAAGLSTLSGGVSDASENCVLLPYSSDSLSLCA